MKPFTPLQIWHAEKLAKEDAAKAEAALKIRQRNIREWKRHHIACAGLMPYAPRPKRVSKPRDPLSVRRIGEGVREKMTALLAKITEHPEGISSLMLEQHFGWTHGNTYTLLRLLKDEGSIYVVRVDSYRREAFFGPVTSETMPAASVG